MIGNPGIPGTLPGLRVIRGCGPTWRGSALALAGMCFTLLVSGCWLSPATPDPPTQTRVARPIPLTQGPDSTLANIKEAFRVGSVQAYMRSIYQDPGKPEDFQSFFDQEDLKLAPDEVSRELMRTGWRSAQEQNAVGSVMNAVVNAEPDTGRANIVVMSDEGTTPEGRVLRVRYRFNIALGSATYSAGTAYVTFRTNTAGEWQISIWTDAKEGVGVPSWGELRFKNRS
jgi:hypothetical protein